MYAPRTGVASRAVPAEKVGCSGVLTLGEARALHHVVHLLGLGDAAAADAAREVELRPERRLKVMFPDQGILLKSVRYD